MSERLPVMEPVRGSDSNSRLASASEWQGGFGQIEVRREVMWLALGAAEMCWAVPVFWALTWNLVPHPPLLLWLGMLVLLLGFFFFYRALVSADLTLRLQQALLATGLLLCIGLVLRFHVLAGSGLRAVDWLLMPFQSEGAVPSEIPLSWAGTMLLIYLWARAIHLANRSLSVQQVGFSFRSGVVVLIAVSLLVQVFSALDTSGFIIAYFFFALVAVALARIEEVSRLPNSTRVPFSSFWIGSTLGAVAVLAVLGLAVALFLTGGGLDRLLHLLAPLLQIVQIVIAALGTLLVMLIEWILGLFSLDLGELGVQLRDALSQIELMEPPPPVLPPEGEGQAWQVIIRVLQAFFAVVLPVAIVVLILLFTWRKMRQRTSEEGSEESRESLLSSGMVASGLQSLLKDGLDRLGELAGLVRRFGPGTRFLAAVSIRRIYGNMVRMATDAGYPRAKTQTPYEYLEILHQAFPTSEQDMTIITEAYVNAHYGEVPDSHKALQRIRDCWERVRAQESKGRSTASGPGK